MRSPRRWVPVLGWLAATATAIGLASVAMLPVLRTATDGEGTLVTMDQLKDVGQVSAAPTTSAPAAPSPQPSARRSTSSSPTPRKTQDEEGDESPVPEEKPEPTTAAPATTQAPQTSTEDGWTVTTSGGVKTFVRSFKVEGGKAVIRAKEGEIELVTATPSDGYAVQTVQNSPDNLAVYFNEVNHSFIVHVVWQDGKPFAQVSEVG